MELTCGHKILVVGPVGAGGLRNGDHTVIEMVVRALDAGVVAVHLVVACPVRLDSLLAAARAELAVRIGGLHALGHWRRMRAHSTVPYEKAVTG